MKQTTAEATLPELCHVHCNEGEKAETMGSCDRTQKDGMLIVTKRMT